MTLAALFTVSAAAGRAASPEGRKLHDLFDREWQWQLEEFPTFATYVGDRRYNGLWEDVSMDAIERRKQHARDLLAEVETIDRGKLEADDQLNYDLFLWNAKLDVEGLQFPSELMPINQMGGVHQDVADVFQFQPRSSVKDFEDVIARLHGVPRMVDQTIELLKVGLEKGITPPRVTLREVEQLIGNQIVDDAAASPIYAVAFEEMPDSIGEAEQTRLRTAAKSAITGEVIPAYRKLRKYFAEEYYPHTREPIGLTTLPDGKAWYDHQIKAMTTTDLSADEIHEIGLSEVRRIRSEMESVREQSGFDGDLRAFFEFLRTDSRFFFTDKQTLLLTYRDICKRIDPELTKLFGTLPRLTYGVVPVPEYSEKTQTTAYYMPGSPEAGRPGYFYANTYDLPSRPRWEMEALSLHEAVPGHHLQIAIAQEMGSLPEFRRHGGYTAYIEGWGLYAESLGRELGMYTDPYSKFGQLTYEMWRAIRLVVDTGMHAKGWTREQAIEFFEENAGKAGHDIVVEVDRYIVWPGQALAYKLGELKIKELRSRAKRELGESFDIRQFHDVVLAAGPLPLAVLEDLVEEWIATRKGDAS